MPEHLKLMAYSAIIYRVANFHGNPANKLLIDRQSWPDFLSGKDLKSVHQIIGLFIRELHCADNINIDHASLFIQKDLKLINDLRKKARTFFFGQPASKTKTFYPRPTP